MGRCVIPEGKKRYQITLTVAKVDRFQTLCKRLGFPRNTMSNAIDDLIDSISETFQVALDKGTMELSDLFRVMGKQMELLEENNRGTEQKRNTDINVK